MGCLLNAKKIYERHTNANLYLPAFLWRIVVVAVRRQTATGKFQVYTWTLTTYFGMMKHTVPLLPKKNCKTVSILSGISYLVFQCKLLYGHKIIAVDRNVTKCLGNISRKTYRDGGVPDYVFLFFIILPLCSRRLVIVL